MIKSPVWQPYASSDRAGKKLPMVLLEICTDRCRFAPSKKFRSKWSYDKMLIDWVRSGWTWKYLALSQDAWSSLRSDHTSWPQTKYFSVLPSHSVRAIIYYILLFLKVDFFFSLTKKIFSLPENVMFSIEDLVDIPRPSTSWFFPEFFNVITVLKEVWQQLFCY